jgi:type IV secretion system protein VirB3
MNLKPTTGLEVPLHRSLTEPMMVAGLPRTVALVLWTSVCAFAFGLRQLWVLPIGLVIHVACAAAAKADPYIFDVLGLALRAGRRLDP